MKQMEVTTKKIGDNTFFISPFPAFTSARISGDLASVIAPILGGFAPMLKGVDAENAENTEDIMNKNMDEVLPVLSDALSHLEGDTLEGLLKQLLIDHKNIAYENEDGDAVRLTFDVANELFCGEMQDMFVLCWEVIKLNFGGFFKKIAGQSGSLLDITKLTKKIPKAKIGTKGGATST